jgi:hypothetical protein
VGFIKLDPQPEPRASGLDYDTRAPGLYPDETALKLSEGFLVAVSVVPKRMDNGGGVAFTAWARWIHGDGTVRLDRHGNEVELCVTRTADGAMIERFGLAGFARDLVLMMLGEEPSLMIDVDVGEGAVEPRPLVDVHREIRFSASIRQAIGAAKAAAPFLDAGELLEL